MAMPYSSDIILDFKRMNTGIEAVLNRQLGEMGLTAAQGYLLFFALQHSNASICSAEIHRELGFSRATVSVLMKKLREKGYIRFLRCQKDDRQKVIEVTETGRSLKTALDLCLEEAAASVYHDFSPEEEKQLCRLHRKLLHNILEWKGDYLLNMGGRNR